nr:hypothetical protein [Mucilaginibacter sp. L294]
MSFELTPFIAEILADIQSIEDDAGIYQEVHFNARANAIDFIDFHVIDRINGLLSGGPNTALESAKKRVETAKNLLEKIDITLFKRLREQISSGAYPEGFFKDLVHKYLGDEASPAAGKAGYDNLDAFVNGLLSNQPLPEASIPRDPEMVFYQQTPARIIFELAERAASSENTFFDIGSGLGHVPILVNLLTGAKTRGIEYEPAYCDYAAASASQLNLANVAFINTTAQNGDYSEGSVFFMYTPFEGLMLQQMLEILKTESLKKPIRIFTYGPCSPQVARQGWLSCVNGPADDVYTLYEFRSLIS